MQGVGASKVVPTNNSSISNIISHSANNDHHFSDTKDFRLALLGNVDSGKSTLCGVLSRGLLDDGNGLARSYVLRHQHEQKRGQTSSVAFELLGFNESQQVIPKILTGHLHGNAAKPKVQVQHNKEFYEIATSSQYRCTLVDLCGHEKYLKTTIYGLTGLKPDLCLVIIGANHGVQKMTREHLGLCCALKVPFFIVVTKIDMAPANILKETTDKVKRVLSRAGRKACYVTDETSLNTALQLQQTWCPVFEISAVTGQNMQLLRDFIRCVTVRYSKAAPSTDSITDEMSNLEVKDGDEELEFSVDDVFQVTGVGLVIGGTVVSGTVSVNDRLLVGPDKSGVYKSVVVKSIHRQCVPSSRARTGQHCTLNLRSKTAKEPLRKGMFRKGMVALNEADIEKVSSRIKTNTVREFRAWIKVLHHSTTIDKGYSPMLHLGVVRQAAAIVAIHDKEGKECVARTGSEVDVRFRFVYHSEFIKVGSAVVFREGRAKGCGKVTELIS